MKLRKRPGTRSPRASAASAARNTAPAPAPGAAGKAKGQSTWRWQTLAERKRRLKAKQRLHGDTTLSGSQSGDVRRGATTATVQAPNAAKALSPSPLQPHGRRGPCESAPSFAFARLILAAHVRLHTTMTPWRRSPSTNASILSKLHFLLAFRPQRSLVVGRGRRGISPLSTRFPWNVACW